MRKALLTTTAIALLVPASAMAKTGLEFQNDPESEKVGSTIPFTMHIFNEPRTPSGHATPVRGVRALVTFTSESGRVIRVRAGRTDRFGVAHGSVRFSDKGPWTTSFDVKHGGIYTGAEYGEPIEVGSALTPPVSPAQPARHAAPQPHSQPAASFPWVWVLSFASIGSALLVLGMRRRGRWGAA